MPFTYLVITRVPPDGDWTNLAMALDLWIDPQSEGKPMDTPHKSVVDVYGARAAIMFKAPVFAVGEVIITRDGDRECVGAGRKPSKWGVEYEEFTSIEDAVKCAEEALAAA